MKQLNVDTHVHTEYSWDSVAEIEDYCQKAICDGVDIICFTEHVDSSVNDSGYMYYNADSFFKSFLPSKEKYRGRLELLCGIEFAAPQYYSDIMLEYAALPYDYVLGSIHCCCNDQFPGNMAKEGVPAEICYESYWDEVLAAVKAGGFDCLAHIDFPKRYYTQLLYSKDKINEIFGVMLGEGICLEINTSSLRSGRLESTPDKELLAIYKSCGGKYVTVGSDAHKAADLFADCIYAKELIEYFGFEEAFFRERKLFALTNEVII